MRQNVLFNTNMLKFEGFRNKQDILTYLDLAYESILYSTPQISDSEERETSSDGGTSDSSIHTIPSESQAPFASKSHAVRKAG